MSTAEAPGVLTPCDSCVGRRSARAAGAAGRPERQPERLGGRECVQRAVDGRRVRWRLAGHLCVSACPPSTAGLRRPGAAGPAHVCAGAACSAPGKAPSQPCEGGKWASRVMRGSPGRHFGGTLVCWLRGAAVLHSHAAGLWLCGQGMQGRYLCMHGPAESLPCGMETSDACARQDSYRNGPGWLPAGVAEPADAPAEPVRALSPSMGATSVRPRCLACFGAQRRIVT